MYDADTADLIRSTPQLTGLDRNRLPEQLTDAFAKIAAARIRLRASVDFDRSELVQIIGEMQRLAFTNEALVAASPDRNDRAAAAFVAGSAHQLCFNAKRIGTEQDPSLTFLEAQSISPNIAAMLLFLIAEATADSNELAARIDVSQSSPIQFTLIEALKGLAKGDLVAINATPLPPTDTIADEEIGKAAVLALYFRLLVGVRSLASGLLATDGAEPDLAIQVFRDIQRLSSAVAPADGWLGNEVGAFAGPHHLACLLIAVAGDLAGSAVTAVDPPGGVDPETWLKSMKRIATRRPYLWRNHRDAIDAGYLEPHNSAAVSFPTGAGKSTLAELKVSATLLSNKKVVFLAPTNALVGQTTAAMRKAFSDASVSQETFDEQSFLTEEDELPEIFVMTPESCLAQMSFAADVFEGVGLLVFDECHLLHGGDESRGRRALDAMLCIMNFAARVPDSNFLLLSAMMKNTDQIAGWLEGMTGRTCLSLSLSWKPTRQLRGSIVYPQADIMKLSNTLHEARLQKKTKAPSTADKKALASKPLGLFSLKQTWATRRLPDYALLELSEKSVQLSGNKYWQLTPNSGVVSSAIATEAAKGGIKTLVFFQTIRNAVSAKNKITEAMDATEIPLLKEELGWLRTATLEMGASNHLFVDVKKGNLSSPCVVHHGLLLPEERELCESLYLRSDGAIVMAATSTVAQGMNLPSEFVIIAEDSRFDEAKNRREVLEAQELLNAAGRAGRAGQNANGIVLVVPGRVIGIDFEDATIGTHWSTLQKVFGQSDQCLDIDDPLTAILDRVHASIDKTGELERYAIARLASPYGADASSDGLEHALRNSLGAYHARKRGDQTWIESRIKAAVDFQSGQAPESDDELLHVQVASTLGIPTTVVSRLAKDILSGDGLALKTVPAWCNWFFSWMSNNSDLFDQIFRPESLNDLFGTEIENLKGAAARAEFAIPVLQRLTNLWMCGRPLNEIQASLGTANEDLKNCIDARKFVVRVIPELAYLFGIPALLRQRQIIASKLVGELQPALSQLGRCLRYGLENEEQAALNQHLRSARLSRRHLHQRFAQIAPYLTQATSGDTWEAIMARIEASIAAELNDRV